MSPSSDIVRHWDRSLNRKLSLDAEEAGTFECPLTHETPQPQRPVIRKTLCNHDLAKPPTALRVVVLTEGGRSKNVTYRFLSPYAGLDHSEALRMTSSERMAKVFRNRFGHVRAGWRILFYLVFTVALHALLDSPLNALLQIPGEDLGNYSLLFNRFVGKVLKLVFVLVPGLVLLKWVDKRPVTLLGLGRYRGALRELLAGMLMGVILIVVGVAILWSTRLASFSFNGFSSGMLWYLLGVLVVLVISASYEEVLFRGYVFQSLIEGTGFWIAVAIYSLLFGAAHLDNTDATIYTIAVAIIAGVCLGTIYYRTRTLWMCIGVHFTWNWMMGPVFGMGITGSRFLRRSLFTYEASESRMIQGADAISEIVFGLILIALTVYLWRARWLKPAEYNRSLWEPYTSDKIKSTPEPIR